MEQLLNLRGLKSEKDASQCTSLVINLIVEDNRIKKQEGWIFLTALQQNLQNPSSSPQSKFYSVMIIRDLAQNGYRNVLGLLSGHTLLTYLTDIALNIDPKKSISQKGSLLFSKHKQVGNKYMRLILQCLVYLGENFVMNKTTNQTTRFRKNYLQLIDAKVTLPKQFIYFKQKSAIKSKKQQNLPKETPQENTSKGLYNQIIFTTNKIQTMIQDLQKIQNLNTLIQVIRNNHQTFTKFHNRFMQIYQSALGQRQEVVNIFLKNLQFLHYQHDLYHKSPQIDYIGFKDSLIHEYDHIFNLDDHPKKIQTKQNNLQLPPLKKTNQPIKKTNSNVYEQQSRFSKPQPPKQPIPQYRNNNHVNGSTKPIKQFFQIAASRSRSKNANWHIVCQSIDKQKKSINANPPKKRKNVSNSKVSYISSSPMTKSLVNSQIHSIFHNPPNLHAPFSTYQGNLIGQNKQIHKILYELKKQQGLKKFKLSNIRNKNILYQNDHLQIGYKSQQLYQNIDQYSSLIGIQLFIGNKTTNNIHQFKLEFLGDQNTLLYSNPKEVSQFIDAGCQLRHQLMVIPKKIPFNFMNMRISYCFNGLMVYNSSVLPASMLKFATYSKISQRQISQIWHNAHKLKSQPFKLSQCFPPIKFLKEIPQLVELTSYSNFIVPGSKQDYALGCQIILMEIYQGILKINIRPDLTVVLQVGYMDNDQQVQRYYKFYLETLQFILKQTQI